MCIRVQSFSSICQFFIYHLPNELMIFHLSFLYFAFKFLQSISISFSNFPVAPGMAVVCPCCLFGFDSSVLLAAHLREPLLDAEHAHHDFACPFCGRSAIVGAVAFAQYLEQNHREEQSSSAGTADIVQCARLCHTCAHCGRTFRKAWDLQRHERTHTGARPFACVACERRFRLKTHLDDHARTHREPSEQFACSVCAKFFLSRSALKLHFRVHSGETPFRCRAAPDCTEAFRTRKLMLSHYRRCHELLEPDDEAELNESLATERRIAFNELVKLNAAAPSRKRGSTGRQTIKPSERSAFSAFRRHSAGVATTSGAAASVLQLPANSGNNNGGANNFHNQSQQQQHPGAPTASAHLDEWSAATAARLQQQQFAGTYRAVAPRSWTPEAALMLFPMMGGQQQMVEARQLFGSQSCLPTIDYTTGGSGRCEEI